jgi:hypothetical protein
MWQWQSGRVAVEKKKKKMSGIGAELREMWQFQCNLMEKVAVVKVAVAKVAVAKVAGWQCGS